MEHRCRRAIIPWGYGNNVGCPLKDFQSPLTVPILLILGTLAGAFWGAIPGVLKAILNLDEIVATLMLNYIAYYWVNYFIYGPWKDPHGYNFPLTAVFPEHTWLPTIGNTGIHSGIFIAFGMVVIVYILLDKTRWGFDLGVVGDNEKGGEIRWYKYKEEHNLCHDVEWGSGWTCRGCSDAGSSA